METTKTITLSASERIWITESLRDSIHERNIKRDWDSCIMSKEEVEKLIKDIEEGDK